MADRLGRLCPLGGGDAIELTQDVITVGRRESCDLRLKYSNVSSTHCELSFRSGMWHVRDLGSSNGIKVNGVRMMQKKLLPGDELGIAGHLFKIEYDLPEGYQHDDQDATTENVFGASLMERAGLAKPKSPKSSS